jgi:aminoglycoside phosphotransferase (APT) family kinase protein
MHADELDIDEALVGRLIAGQFPQWARLPVRRVPSSGTDNAIFRLGDALAVRLPRIHWAVDQVAKEQQWLPRFAPRLPLAVPVPLARGEPAEGYPHDWSVVPWLAGDNATAGRLPDLRRAAADLARFLLALRRLETTGGPPPADPTTGRGVPLAARDDYTRSAVAGLGGLVDGAAVTTAWEAALAAPAWDGPPVWIHGDLQPGNLLADRGRLSAVIDWGSLGLGDPACDLIIAWTLFSGESRAAFRAALDVDDATWARGRGWALSIALVALPYYLETNPAITAASRQAIASVLADAAAQ